MVDYDNELKKRVDMDLIYLNKQINDIFFNGFKLIY